jgi:hypothetical protein
MPRHASPPRLPPDQADGRRRRVAAGERHVLGLVHNPFVAFTGVALERLAAGLAGRGLHTLVVDAADTASNPHELAGVDLGACIEPLSAQVSFLAARGLPRRWIDGRGSAASFADALLHAAPGAGAVLLHAGASDLRRVLAGRASCPLVLAGTHSQSVTHAYASIKLLAQRDGIAACDLVVVGTADRHTEQVAQRLADCADHFLGVALRAWAVVDAADDPRDPITPELAALLALQLRAPDAAPPIATLPPVAGHGAARLN